MTKNATDAINKCLNEKFDFILTDINLERVTGDTIILKMKKLFGNPNYSTPSSLFAR